MANVRQSRPDSACGFPLKFMETFSVVPSPLGSGFQEARNNKAERAHLKKGVVNVNSLEQIHTETCQPTLYYSLS